MGFRAWFQRFADGSSGGKQAGDVSKPPEQLLQSLAWTNGKRFQKYRQAFLRESESTNEDIQRNYLSVNIKATFCTLLKNVLKRLKNN